MTGKLLKHGPHARVVRRHGQYVVELLPSAHELINGFYRSYPNALFSMQKIYPGICNGCLAICGVEAAESSLHFAVVNAARKYDDGYNVKFESFCWRQIAAQFQEDIRRETLHLSRNQVAAVDVPVADPDRPDPLGRELLGKLVNRLPKRYRRTVIVCYGLDRKTPPKPHEAAKILRINRKQMEQRLEMALNLMRIYYMQGLHQDVN